MLLHALLDSIDHLSIDNGSLLVFELMPQLGSVLHFCAIHFEAILVQRQHIIFGLMPWLGTVLPFSASASYVEAVLVQQQHAIFNSNELIAFVMHKLVPNVFDAACNEPQL